MATAVKVARPEHGEQEYRVVEGFHYDDGPPGCECDGCVVQWQGGALDCDHKVDPKKSGSRAKVCACGSILTGGGNHRYVSYGSYIRQAELDIAKGIRPDFSKQPPLSEEEYQEDRVVSKVDLCQRFNAYGGRTKFVRVKTESSSRQQQAKAQPPAPFPLEKMTFAELRAVADENGIDLKGEAKKDKVLELIRSHLNK